MNHTTDDEVCPKGSPIPLLLRTVRPAWTFSLLRAEPVPVAQAVPRYFFFFTCPLRFDVPAQPSFLFLYFHADLACRKLFVPFASVPKITKFLRELRIALLAVLDLCELKELLTEPSSRVLTFGSLSYGFPDNLAFHYQPLLELKRNYRPSSPPHT